MANRAYLYPNLTTEFVSGRPDRYYDSRHSIPIGWFFFFRPSDVVLLDRRQGPPEVKLVAPKSEALDLFRSRRPLLTPYLPGQPLLDAADTIVADLTRWPGAYLLMDPFEVVDDDLHHQRQFKSIIRSLDSSDAKQIDAALRPYFGQLSTDPDECLCQVLGYTYPFKLMG